MPKVVFTDYYYPDANREKAILAKVPGLEIVDLQELQGGVADPRQLEQHLRDADAVITQYARLDAELIDTMEHCLVLARYGIGVDNIDVSRAAARGIAVANVPDYCVEEVSDSAVAHLLNAARRIAAADRALRRRAFSYEELGPMRRISTCTVGLLAFGNIARRTAEKLRPFGCTILFHDPWFKGASEIAAAVSFEELLERSDLLSIHAPLTESTRNRLDGAALTRMKAGSVIVSTSRGGIINEKALYAALQSGHIAHASLDVLECPDKAYCDSPLLELGERVTLTPHMSWCSTEALEELRDKVARNVATALTTGKPVYEVHA